MTDSMRGGARPGPQALSTAISAVLAVSATTAATAQEQPAAVTGLDEVIVTATKRAERLQDVSESISAFDSGDIAMRGLQQIDDVAKYIPGLSLAQREPGGTTIVFRGVASSGIQFGGVSSSALYLDEQPITQSGRSPDPRFIDIERIEALRGPQGTLYGASSQSGTLRVITDKPDPSGFDAWAEAQVTDVQDGGTGYDVSAMVNIPLAEDRVSLRLVGFAAEDAGYIDNVLSDSPGGTFDNADVVEEDVNSVETTGARAALRFDVNENLDATFGLLYQDLTADGHSDVSEGVGDLNQVRFEEESLDDEWYQASLTVNAATAVRRPRRRGVLLRPQVRLPGGRDRLRVHVQPERLRRSTTSAATRAASPRTTKTRASRPSRRGCSPTTMPRAAGPGWAASSTARRPATRPSTASSATTQDTPAFAYFNYFQYNQTGSPLGPTENWFLGRYETELEQRAVFGEIGFDVTENFTITAGGRWFEYDRTFNLHQESPAGFTAALPFTGPTLTDAADAVEG